MYITVFFSFLYFWRIIFLSLYFVVVRSYVLKNIKKIYRTVEMLNRTADSKTKTDSKT